MTTDLYGRIICDIVFTSLLGLNKVFTFNQPVYILL